MTTSQAVEISKVEGKKNSKSFFEKSWENPLKFLPYIKFILEAKKSNHLCDSIRFSVHSSPKLGKPLGPFKSGHVNSPSPLASQMGCQISCRHHLRSRWKKHPWQKIAWQKKSCLFLCVKLTVCTYKIGRPKRRFHLPTLFVSGRENAVFIPPQKGPFQKEKLVFQSRHFSEASC